MHSLICPQVKINFKRVALNFIAMQSKIGQKMRLNFLQILMRRWRKWNEELDINTHINLNQINVAWFGTFMNSLK